MKDLALLFTGGACLIAFLYLWTLFLTSSSGPIRLYLDDERDTPEGWERVYTAKQAIDRLSLGDVAEVSLDHDLGDLDGNCGDGYEVACWIEEQAHMGQLPKLKWNVHSANRPAANRMAQALLSADRCWNGTRLEDIT